MQPIPLSIQLFGGFEVRVRGDAMRRVRPRSVEWLLALLVLRPGRDVSRSWLAGTLWPESGEAQSLRNLRRNLMELRQALGPEADRLGAPGHSSLRLDLGGASADVVEFDTALAAGDEPSLQRAVAIYRGPLLEGCVEEWVLPERASREEACLRALESLADRAAERGELAAALGYLGEAAGLDPLRDSTQRRRMQVLTASGHLPAALLTYRDYRLRLHREMNLEPDPETTHLFQQLRSGARRTAHVESSGTREAGGYPLAGVSVESAGKVNAGPSPLPDAAGSVAFLEIELPGDDSIQNPNAQRASEIQNPAPLPRPLTALIGREQEVQEVVRSVRAARLVTLTGGGGVGKTRLAIQAAEELAPDFPQGAAFIELAALAEPALLPAHVAAALGVRDVAAQAAAGPPGPDPLVKALTAWLGPHPLLLVLDNCEHLVEAVAALTYALLTACPALRILATSRQRLGVTGEVLWRVPSLAVPPIESLELRVESPATTNPSDLSTLTPASGYPPGSRVPELPTLMSYPAAQLFAERATAVRSGFRVEGPEDAVAVAQICRRLDGIPLALELAAARVGLLTLPQIATRLDDRFRLLTSGARAVLPRHQTLRALIDWSYHLLPEAERTLLRRLSVFAGGWTLEAAEAICSDFGFWILDFGLPATSKAPEDRPSLSEPIQNPNAQRAPEIQNSEVLDLLCALEEKSLVLVELRDGAIRYRMLETVREYGREQLASSGELAEVRKRHRDWYLQLAEQAEAAARRSGQTERLTRLEADLDNMRAALAWCQEEADAGGDGAGAALRLVTASWWLWYPGGRLTEGLSWLEGALERGRHLPPAARAPALVQAAHLCRDRGDRDRAGAFFQAARGEYDQLLALARSEGNRREVAGALLSLCELVGDPEAAWVLCVEARQLYEELGEPAGIAHSLEWMAGIAMMREDRQTARVLAEERLAICRTLGRWELLIHALGALGHLERDEGHYERARALYQESLVLRRGAGHQMALAQALEDFAVLAGREWQAERAIRLLGAGEAFCETLGARPPVAHPTEYERTVAESRAALGEAAFAAAWAEGRAMSLDEAVEYALEGNHECR